MRPGPAKQFDPELALANARDLFWRRGFDGTGIADLEAALGVGRKSLYDTFGNKRALYVRALEHYRDSVVAAICRGLERADGSALANLERVLVKLAEHHGSGASLGCLLGVGLAQVTRDDRDVVAALRAGIARLEDAFDACLRRARDAGELRADVRPRDAAHQLTALVQGLALFGRIAGTPTSARAAVRTAIDGLRASTTTRLKESDR